MVHNVIIIGSGPAGHTAAIYAGRALLKPIMFEGRLAGGVAAGGQLTTTTEIENFPGFPDGIDGTQLMMQMRQQSIHSGCEIFTKTVDAVTISSDPKNTPHKVMVGNDVHEAYALIIATGATAKRLGLPGEEIYRQNGISACAVCDGGLPIFRDKHLIVIGGGDSACEEASYLTKFASKVTMLVRGSDFRASKVMVERVNNNQKIEVLFHTEGVEVVGDGQVMTGIKIINNQTKETSELVAGGLFYAIGHKPNTDFLAGQVALDDAGYIYVKPGTSKVINPSSYDSSKLHEAAYLPGVFAGGDVQDKVYRQAITSAGTGCMAALEAEHFLVGNGLA